MISVAQALDLIAAKRPDYGTEQVPLSKALGARSAEDVKAHLTMPPFAASAMDGYAARLSDSTAGNTLRVIGEAPAGMPYAGQVGKGEAIRIFTGGHLPSGADNIIIQENVTRNGETIKITTGSETSRHIRRAGIDFKKNDTLITKNTIMGPADIALAASGNHNHLSVYRRPKVAILANGDELQPPGSALKPGQIISSNSAGIGALVKHWGGDPIDMGIAADNLKSITAVIHAAKDADIIVPVGGASVGDYDYMKQAFEALGYTKSFSKIAVRPGKPTWFGTLGQQRVLGLPGNPASAAVCAHLFLRPLITGAIKPSPAILDADLPANGSRETYLRGQLYMKDGQLTAKPFPRQDSSLITPLARSNALIKLAANSGPWQQGDTIETLPLGIGPDIL